MRLGLLGFGLIGGSIARALAARQPGVWEVVAWSPSGDGPAAAARHGAIDRPAMTPEEAIEGADIAVLAVPPLACLELLDRLAGAGVAPPTLLTDVASTKRAIVARAAARGLPFVGGHPMAGRETTGYAAADPDLFVDRPWVVIPAEGAERVETLALATGARPVRLSAEEHDRAVASVSHLPLVLAAALVESATADPGWRHARGLSATGWRDMTRLARGDVEMGAGIAATNADLLAERLRNLRTVLDRWLDDLDRAEPDADRLRRRFAEARARLDDAG